MKLRWMKWLRHKGRENKKYKYNSRNLKGRDYMKTQD
jgi:hypothetical protein